MVLKDNILSSDLPLPHFPEIPYDEYILQNLQEILPTLAKDAVYMRDWTTGKRVLYADIIPSFTRLSCGLRKRGFRAGDAVCVFAANDAEFPLLSLAVWRCGGLITTCSYTGSAGEVAATCLDTGAQYICCDKRRAQTALKATSSLSQFREVWLLDGDEDGCISLKEIMSSKLDANIEGNQESSNGHTEVNLDTVIWVPYSSGTSGLPKGIMHTHRTMVAMTSLFRKYGITTTGPYAFVNGMVNILGCIGSLTWMTCGVESVTLSKYSELDYLKAIEETKAKAVIAFPVHLSFFARDPIIRQHDLSSLEFVTSGGSTWDVQDEVRLFEIFPNLKTFAAMYGMTEVWMISSRALEPENYQARERKLGSSGWLCPGVSVKVLDPDTGMRLGVSQTGEICVRTACMTKGYLNHPEATAKFIKDGWAHTGDEGYFDETGQLFVTARIKELIIYRNEHVPPLKLENLFRTLDVVQDVCVVGLPHPIDGERPVAAVVLRPGAAVSLKKLKEYVDERVNEEEKLRGGIFALEKIPSNESGKVLRREVLKQIISQIEENV